MAEMRTFPFYRHFRSEANFHVVRYRRGTAVEAGKGLSFWFQPLGASIAEVPMDDRSTSFHFHGRTRDFQTMTVQGDIVWRAADAEALMQRVDFSIDLVSGAYLGEPLEQIEALLTGLAQQQAAGYLAEGSVPALLGAGAEPVQRCIADGLNGSDRLAAMGLAVVSVRVAELKPTAELERALQTPTFEALQQKADEATFERRALAVEKERAIAENELQNQIELARRTESLIAQEGQNDRNRALEEAAARQIEADAEAACMRAIEQARTDAEAARIDIYRGLAPSVLYGLAARDFADKLTTIEHLNVTPDLLGTLVGDLARAGTERLRIAGAAPGAPEG